MRIDTSKGFKVLSLYDGISCGMVALERAGISVERYVAYEIDKYAIKVSQKNYPQIEHTEGISNTQRYKCIGNGWTVDVIAHIFNYLEV